MNKREAKREAHFAVTLMIKNSLAEGMQFPEHSEDDNRLIWAAVGELHRYHERLAAFPHRGGRARL